MLLAHFDWSVNKRKRWCTLARRCADGGWDCRTPEPAGALDTVFARLRLDQPEGAILAGFDFPIGLPREYAARAGIGSFVDALASLKGEFYSPAESPRQISLARPFYPKRPGGARKEHLLRALGVSSLLRRCERATARRAPACELFWTQGAKQAGRGAALGWSKLLGPGLQRGEILLWPFHGELPDLLGTGRIVVAESYPAETYGHLGFPRNFGKGSAAGRRRQAPLLREWCARQDVRLPVELQAMIDNGFDHDDAFDSFVGLLGLAEAAVAVGPQSLPPDPEIRTVEGWILGMAGPPEGSAKGVATRNGQPRRPLGSESPGDPALGFGD